MDGITIVLAVIAGVLVFAIAAGTIGREAHRLDAVAPRAVYQLDEAVDFVADRLPPASQARLTPAEAAAHAGRPVAEMPVRMMLANPELRTVLVSIHVSLRAALDAVTFDNVLQTLRITHAALRAVLGRAPRIGVAGLNPHAGEGGLFGREEIETIAPRPSGRARSPRW